MGFHDRDMMMGLMRGDSDACNFLDAVYDIAHGWDDLVDGDAPVDVNALLFGALTLSSNPFYRQHMGYLQPILVNSITNWRVANLLELTDSDYELKIAFILRSSYADMVTQSAVCIGGIEWGVEVGRRIRLHMHAETYTGYLADLAMEKAARAAGE